MLNLAFWALVVFVLVFPAALVRLYWLARHSSRHNAKERRALELILKQGASVAAVLAVLYGFVQFLEQNRQKVASEERTQFAKSMEKIVSNDKKANLGGITIIGQLAQTDAVRHWSMVEVLTDYIRSSYRRPQSEIRSYGENLDKYYHDLPSNNGSLEDVSLIPAQLALTILGTRQRQYEEKRFLQSAPRARIYLEADRVRNLHHYYSECDESYIQKHLKRDWEDVVRPQDNIQLVREMGDMCPDELSDILPRLWIDMSKSKLPKVDLSHMDFEGANFADSDLSFSKLVYGKFAKAVFQTATLVGTNMWGTDLRGADLRWADVRGSDLGWADLRDAALSGAKFSRLGYGNFSQVSDFYQANLEHALMIVTDLREVRSMSGANMRGITAFRADFRGADVAGDGQYTVCMNGAYLDQACLEGADLRGVDLRNAKLEHAQLMNADLRGARFDYADLMKADLSGAKIDGATTFLGAVLVDIEPCVNNRNP